MCTDRVAKCFENQTIFITGATGFVGKVFLEKILRSCSQVKRVYVLVRPKKGKKANERLNDLFSGPIFQLAKTSLGTSFYEKVIPIQGDISFPNLGMSTKDRQMVTEEVVFIYHCAAVIRFDESLRNTIAVNTTGTKFMLELAEECKKLELFVYLSTAYCQLNQRILFEKTYPPPINPHCLIQMLEWVDDKLLSKITKDLLGDYPNAYAYSKALSEALVTEKSNKIPVVIIRPSVVIPIWKEPIPGWSDHLNGPAGILVGAGKGVIRSMYISEDMYADFVPVDVVANTLAILPFAARTDEIKRVYNLTTSADVKMTWKELVEMGRTIIVKKLPLNGVVWYPGGSMKSSKLTHTISAIFVHYLPAIIVDFFLVLLGYKPVLWKIHTRIRKGFEIFDYYANKQWDFNNQNAVGLGELLNEVEKKKHYTHVADADREKYFHDCIHGARLFILNEPDETIPSAKRHMKTMWYVDLIFKAILIGIAYILVKYVLQLVFEFFYQ